MSKQYRNDDDLSPQDGRGATGRLLAAALAGLLLAAGPAQATTTATTNNYDAQSLSQNISLSCKELRITSDAVVEANCNSIQEGVFTTTKSTIDMDNHVQCSMLQSGLIGIEWGTALDYSGSSMGSMRIELSSDGKKYLFEAKCSYPADNSLDSTGTVDMSDTTDGLKNTGATGGPIQKR